jgi:hypothetical protein
MKRAYLDLEIGDSRAAYKRACEFVEHNHMKYGLSSNVLTELGGREKKSVPGLFENDYAWAHEHPGRVQTSPQVAARLVFELNTPDSPLASENFFALCTGSKGASKETRTPLHYLGCKIHRYEGGLGIIQGGDIN